MTTFVLCNTSPPYHSPHSHFLQTVHSRRNHWHPQLSLCPSQQSTGILVLMVMVCLGNHGAFLQNVWGETYQGNKWSLFYGRYLWKSSNIKIQHNKCINRLREFKVKPNVKDVDQLWEYVPFCLCSVRHPPQKSNAEHLHSLRAIRVLR